jgi:hypothetical protein
MSARLPIARFAMAMTEGALAKWLVGAGAHNWAFPSVLDFLGSKAPFLPMVTLGIAQK